MAFSDLDNDQKIILYVYSRYSSEKELTFLQYTAALVIFYYLKQQGVFPEYDEQLLVYDYKDSRRFLWEDKKFMNDINVVRDHGFLNRARLKTAEYRDLNAHYCTISGAKAISDHFGHTVEAENIKKLITCPYGEVYEILLEDEAPVLHCTHCRKKDVVVEGFLRDFTDPIPEKYAPAFL